MAKNTTKDTTKAREGANATGRGAAADGARPASERVSAAQSGPSHSSTGHTEAGHPAPERNKVALSALWFGLFGAPAAWAVQTLVNYSIAAHVCYPRTVPLGAPTIGRGAMWAVLVGISVVMLIIGIAAGLTAFHTWQRTSHESGGHTYWVLDTGDGRTRFMAISALMTSSVFVLAMLVHVASVLTITPCW